MLNAKISSAFHPYAHCFLCVNSVVGGSACVYKSLQADLNA